MKGVSWHQATSHSRNPQPQRPASAMVIDTWQVSKYKLHEVHQSYIACQVRVTAGDSDLCCWVHVMSVRPLSGLCYCVHLAARALLLCSHDVCQVSVVVFTWCLSGLCCCVHMMSVRSLLLCSHDVRSLVLCSCDVCQVSVVVFTCLLGLCCVYVMSVRSVVAFTWCLSGLFCCVHVSSVRPVVVFTSCLSGLGGCVHMMSVRSLLCSCDVFQVSVVFTWCLSGAN